MQHKVLKQIQWLFWVFALQRWHIVPKWVKFGEEKWTFSPLLPSISSLAPLSYSLLFPSHSTLPLPIFHPLSSPPISFPSHFTSIPFFLPLSLPSWSFCSPPLPSPSKSLLLPPSPSFPYSFPDLSHLPSHSSSPSLYSPILHFLRPSCFLPFISLEGVEWIWHTTSFVVARRCLQFLVLSLFPLLFFIIFWFHVIY